MALAEFVHVLDIGQGRQGGVTELVRLCEVFCVRNEGAPVFGLGLLKLAASVVDGGDRSELGDGGVDAQLLARG